MRPISIWPSFLLVIIGGFVEMKVIAIAEFGRGKDFLRRYLAVF